MSEQDGNANTGEGTQDSGTIQDGENVVLTKEDFSKIIGELTGLKMKVGELTNAQNQSRQVVERAVAPPPQRQVGPADIENMTKTEFAQYISQSVGQPILELVMTMAVKEEIRETAAENKDFWDYKDEVYKLTMSNPQMSVKQAYLVAKSENPGKSSLNKPAAGTPPATSPPPARGERPGVARSSVAQPSKMSIKDAANTALKDLLKDLPDEQ